jgi:hypothetical protein
MLCPLSTKLLLPQTPKNEVFNVYRLTYWARYTRLILYILVLQYLYISYVYEYCVYMLIYNGNIYIWLHKTMHWNHLLKRLHSQDSHSNYTQHINFIWIFINQFINQVINYLVILIYKLTHLNPSHPFTYGDESLY